MPRFGIRARLPGPLIIVVLGALLLVYLVWRVGPGAVLQIAASLGWGLGLVIGLGGLVHIVRTWAWRLALLDEKRDASFARMLALRLASEAVGQIGVFGQVFGETVRVSRLGSELPLASRVASVTLDRTLFTFTAALVTIAGMTAVIFVLPLPHQISLYGDVLVIALVGILSLAAVAVRKRWAVLSGTARALGRVGYFGRWIERQDAVILSIETKLLDFFHHAPGAFWGAFALNLAGHGAAILEVYLILWLMGARVTVFSALAVEALTKLINAIGIFNPGNVGTYEGGNMLLAKMIGLTAIAGLTLGLIRRVRALVWGAVGGVCLIGLSRSKPRGTVENTDHTRQLPGQAVAAQPLHAKSQEAGRSHVAVILANDLPGDSYLLSVGGLPVLLRVILGAQRAGAARIVIVVDQTMASRVRKELARTGRLPACVEWYPSGAATASLPAILADVAGEEKRIVLMAADTTYHPSLHRRAAEWHTDNALALTTGGGLTGIYVLPTSLALHLAERCPAPANTLEKLDNCLVSTHSVERGPMPEDSWQRILTPQDRLAAEQKLNGWLVKPTDGIFARTNRRVSIPVSRQIIRFPITPNMVSLFTLGVSFLAGMFFAFGGYEYMVVGALLSVAASILDGCDGEVARLTFQESAFGCWLETICDYLYYLFIFAGMTIGLLRSSGSRVYLIWGALLVFGAVASFLTTGMQRHRLAAERPEQLLAIWQAQASKRASNPFLYLGRHTEFIVRRCFLPYPFLVFALLNITNVAFILAALGANIVWPIALYTYCTFTAPQSASA